MGSQDEQAQPARPALVRRISLASAIALSGQDIPDIDYDVVAELREAEKAYIEEVTSRLKSELAESARTEGGFARVLRVLARTPNVSPTNAKWARWQLEIKAEKGGYEPPRPEGRLLPVTTWEAMGMRVKPEYLFTGEGDHDPRYIAVMLRPVMFPETRDKTDAAGNPVLKDGKPVKERTGKMIFGNRFDHYAVYHEDAVEMADGSGRSLPQPSWYEATGDEAAAEKLWAEVEKLAGWQKLKIDLQPGPNSEGQNAVLQGSTILLNSRTSRAEMATSALRCVAEAYLRAKKAPKDERDVERQQALAASAEFAIASLYGLDAGRQTFPFLDKQLGAFKQENREKRAKRFFDSVKEVTSDFIGYLDPAMRQKVQQEGRALKAKTTPMAATSRAAAFKAQGEAAAA